MNNQITEYLRTIGARGGRKTARRGTQYYRDLQRRNVIVRRRNATKMAARPSAEVAVRDGDTSLW